MELKNYYDFAENDFQFLMQVTEHHITANSLGALSQNICERYIKHLINEYIQVTPDNQKAITEIMTTHNINRLASYWNAYGNKPLEDKTVSMLRSINGYYFSTKYPGDIIETLSDKDIDNCVEVVKQCKNNIDEIIRSLSV